MNDFANVLPGDVGLTRSDHWQDHWIQWAERRKYGTHAPEAHWNHTFLLDSSTTVIEATPNGTMRNSLSEYANSEVLLVRPPYADQAACGAAVKAMVALRGTKYGWLTIACEALTFLTGTRLRFGLKGTVICSGLVSYALTEGGINVGEDEAFNSPADVATYAFAQRWAVIQT